MAATPLTLVSSDPVARTHSAWPRELSGASVIRLRAKLLPQLIEEYKAEDELFPPLDDDFQPIKFAYDPETFQTTDARFLKVETSGLAEESYRVIESMNGLPPLS